MNVKEYNLNQLMEECSEVIKQASKQNRFGRDEVQPGQTETNAQRLREECMDVMLCLRYLVRAGQIERILEADVDAHEVSKRGKIAAMRGYSEALGCLTDE